MILPTAKQIKNCQYSGWKYLGDGLFSYKDNTLGYFTEEGWYTE